MEYESLVVTISELKEEIETTNHMLHVIYHVLYDYVYNEDTRIIEEN